MADKKAPRGTLGKVLRHVRRYTPLLLLSLLLTAVAVFFSLYIPILVGNAIDVMIGEGQVDLAVVGEMLTKVAVSALLSALATWLYSMMNNRITFLVVRDLRNEAFSHIERLPLSYIDSHPHGDIVSRVIADADQFADGLLLGFSRFFSGALTILGTLIFMLTIQPIVALVVVVLTPLSLFVARFIASRTYAMFRAQSEARAEQTALIDEVIGTGKLIRAFGMEDETLDAFDKTNEKLQQTSLRAIFFSSLTNPSTRFINSVVYAGVALAGAVVVISSGGIAMSVGGLSSFLSYANQYTKPFNEISGVISELQNALACAARLFALIEETPEQSDRENASLPAARGEVTLSHVDFSYVPEKPLIRDLSLAVAAGKRIAIVGPTGCGKTTLINLLMRFYDVRGGSIAVDGKDIRTVTRHSLRENYGMVLQDTWLRYGTVRENIAMGKPEATDAEIEQAARAAHAHSFISRLPQGYHTVIGEDGGSLSQGQKQLLCIARVMLCLPPMLILDEATSSIDTRTELRIQKAFALMMQGRTSFIVAHRLSTIREADTILVMKDGNVIEQGSHEELLARGGFYEKLYNSQFAVT
ncbi:MAG: ABC transporter ATP-binding protein [Clostridia bacterium]|nr:ABC transporter ATP-binding protein [Clostridia bacterium]